MCQIDLVKRFSKHLRKGTPMISFSFLSMLLTFCVFSFSSTMAQNCSVSYSITNSWPGGFQAGISITNAGTTAINGWTLQWQFTGNQQVNNLWGGIVSAQGENITVTNANYDGSISAGGTVSGIGFVANSSGANAIPAAFILNGNVCGGANGGRPPSAPTGLTATAGNQQVVLAWTASSGATLYAVKRSTTSGGPFAQVGLPTQTRFTGTGLTNGTTYFYVVSASNSAGGSPHSAHVSATPSTQLANVTITIDPTRAHPISPWIYGMNIFGNIPNPPHFTINRMGGNRWTAHNWETNASNAEDWGCCRINSFHKSRVR